MLWLFVISSNLEQVAIEEAMAWAIGEQNWDPKLPISCVRENGLSKKSKNVTGMEGEVRYFYFVQVTT